MDTVAIARRGRKIPHSSRCPLRLAENQDNNDDNKKEAQTAANIDGTGENRCE